MGSFPESMDEYKRMLEKGHIQRAYQGLMEYFGQLRTHFIKKYPNYDVSGSIYYGYMDMTYFSIRPESLRSRNLKIALVFVHDAFRFEVWLAAKNKHIQTEYWHLFNDSNWNKYSITTPGKGIDSILESSLVEDPNFSDLDSLTKQIEKGILEFISDVEVFLSVHTN